MPIQADYNWTQKENEILFIIPLKNVSANKVDIFISGNFLKVNFSPYILDLFLYGQIDSLKYKKIFLNNQLLLTVYKIPPSLGHWESLERKREENNEESLNKTEKLTLIKEAINERKDLESNLLLKQKEKLIEEEREAVRLQMKLDTSQRERLETLKLKEKNEAEKDLYETFERMKYNEQENKIHNQLEKKQNLTEKNNILKEEKVFKHDDYYNKFELIDSDIDSDSDEKKIPKNEEIISTQEAVEEEEEEIHYIPPPRSTNSTSAIKINFTPRYFPTPMRESKATEEEDWIAKNKIHLNSKGDIKGKVQEEDPLWLKAKGDDFFRNNDCLSAINAYSAALQKNDEYLEALMNRSASYMKVNKPIDSINDCKRGINILSDKIFFVNNEFSLEKFSNSNSISLSDYPPSVWNFFASIIKLVSRKAICQGSLGNYDESYEDFSLAHNIFIKLNQLINDKNAQSKVKMPTANVKNPEDIAHITQILPSITSANLARDSNQIRLISKSVKIRKEADELFALNQLKQAKELYDSSLEFVNGVHIASLVNRAALYIALVTQTNENPSQYYELALKDCSQALSLLEYNENKNNAENLTISKNLNELNLLSSFIPISNTKKFTNYLIVSLSRRASCYFFLEKFSEALKDLKSVLDIDPDNQQVKNDYQKIEMILNEKK